MNENLKAKFQQMAADFDWMGNSTKNLSDNIATLMQSAYELALNDAWISVDDRFPEDSKFYLTCYARDEYYICEPGQMYIRRDGTKCFVDRDEMAINATHWQPLPQPPVSR